MHVRDLFDLSGCTAIVTGGTGLYGTPMSEALAEAEDDGYASIQEWK